jgi:hypothetical protein
MPELVFFRRGEEVLRVSLERQRLVLGRGEHCDHSRGRPSAPTGGFRGKRKGVTLDGASTQARSHYVTASSQIVTGSFTVAGSQGNHSITLIPGADSGSAYGSSVRFYVA